MQTCFFETMGAMPTDFCAHLCADVCVDVFVDIGIDVYIAGLAIAMRADVNVESHNFVGHNYISHNCSGRDYNC